MSAQEAFDLGFADRVDRSGRDRRQFDPDKFHAKRLPAASRRC